MVISKTHTREDLEGSWQILVQQEENKSYEDKGEKNEKIEETKYWLEQHKNKVKIEAGRIQGTHY
jgi:hypothetical protein